MVNLEFYKMSGHGNDFVIVDNWNQQIGAADMPGLAKAVCRRKFGVGADGMVFIEPGPEEVDFAWRFYNADGTEANMCGNAARCVARFAYLTGIAPAQMAFMTGAGVIQALVGPDAVKIKLTPPGTPEMDCPLEVNGKSVTLCTINTGVPHSVIWVDDIEAAQVVEMGRAIRFHPHFQPYGTNVNFCQVLSRQRVALRTYERGVEDETLACGTGSVAAVLLLALQGRVDSPVVVKARSGEELLIHYTRDGDAFKDVVMEGAVRVTFVGRLGPDILL